MRRSREGIRRRCQSRAKERQKNHLVKRLADLGYAVELVPLAS
jgi:hypothetical protein